MATSKLDRLRDWTDEALLDRLQSILINGANGQRSVGDDAQYPKLRREMERRSRATPSLVATHPTVDSFKAAINRIQAKSEREQRVRADFEASFSAETPTAASADWTGLTGPTARITVVKELLPLAQAAVDGMIANLSQPNANGAPLLDSRATAIENLRQLHRALGELLTAVDQGHFDDGLGQGLAASAARYAKRAAQSLRDEPEAYVSSALMLGLFYACGMPDIGGYIAGIALNIRKHTGAN